MYASGDFIESGQQFNLEFCGPRTVWYMDYIVNDLRDKHWESIFCALSAFSQGSAKEQAVFNGIPEESHGRVPLPPSDPPSPPMIEHFKN